MDTVYSFAEIKIKRDTKTKDLQNSISSANNQARVTSTSPTNVFQKTNQISNKFLTFKDLNLKQKWTNLCRRQRIGAEETGSEQRRPNWSK